MPHQGHFVRREPVRFVDQVADFVFHTKPIQDFTAGRLLFFACLHEAPNVLACGDPFRFGRLRNKGQGRRR